MVETRSGRLYDSMSFVGHSDLQFIAVGNASRLPLMIINHLPEESATAVPACRWDAGRAGGSGRPLVVLVSRASQSLTGHELRVDGGFTA